MLKNITKAELQSPCTLENSANMNLLYCWGGEEKWLKDREKFKVTRFTICIVLGVVHDIGARCGVLVDFRKLNCVLYVNFSQLSLYWAENRNCVALH